MKFRSRYVLVVPAAILIAVFFYYAVHFSTVIYNDVQVYKTRVADSYDYTKRTTPLPQGVIDDICLKFAIGPNDARCQPDAVVYGPDFFADIKKYFNELPKQEDIIPIVDEKLGAYLVDCSGSTKDGIYSCNYDLRGDGRYSVRIYFTKDGLFYQIMAPTGGS